MCLTTVGQSTDVELRNAARVRSIWMTLQCRLVLRPSAHSKEKK
ncbi:UNVERIFIED_CONTAM: hypothetical protein GTU68_004889 [Idotea baltica]|nr:hypothetical protein [Idotea baltica]